VIDFWNGLEAKNSARQGEPVETLRLVGYWCSPGDDTYPDPAAWVDPAWDRNERLLVATYLMSGTLRRAYMGYSTCRICGRDNGASEYSDGVYAWPEGLAHYVEEHNVRLPSEFELHARERYLEVDQAEATTDWWLAKTKID
jgi:hypothetical protein